MWAESACWSRNRRARARDAELHRLEIAHARAGVVGAALLDRLDREVERGLGVADAGRRQAVRAERRQRHVEHRIGIAARPREFVSPRVRYMQSARCSGTKTSVARTDLDPVLRMPSNCQSSTIS